MDQSRRCELDEEQFLWTHRRAELLRKPRCCRLRGAVPGSATASPGGRTTGPARASAGGGKAFASHRTSLALEAPGPGDCAAAAQPGSPHRLAAADLRPHKCQLPPLSDARAVRGTIWTEGTGL